MFLLILLFLYALALGVCENYYERDLSIFQFEQKLERLRKRPSDTTVIIGDSRALAIDFVDPKTPGTSSYNYAFSNAGGMYPYPYFLQQLLHQQPTPERIIWSFIPLMLTDSWEIFKDNPNPGASEFYRAARLYQLMDMVQPVSDNLFYHYRKASKNILRAKFDISYEALRKYFQEPDNREILAELFNEESGGVIFSRQHEWEYTADNYLEAIPLTISDNAEIFIREFLELAQRQQIKVFLLNMPIPETILRNRIMEGFYQRYFEFMEGLRQEFPATLYLYQQLPAYENNFFIDGSHLNEKGARRFQSNDYPVFLNWIEQNQ